MKKFLLVIGLLFFTLNVHASTDCSTGCDVDGATIFDTNIQYLNWNSAGNDASVTIRTPSGSILATEWTANVSDWVTGKHMLFYPQIDGQYNLEVYSQGTDNNYFLNLNFDSGSTPSSFSDTNCTGSSCGGNTKIYKLNVSNSPPVSFDDNVMIPIQVKGGTQITASVKILSAFDNCLYNCNAYFSVRRLSDGATVAVVSTEDWPDWTGSPRILKWTPDYDGNYALEFSYEGPYARFDTNFSFVGTDDANHAYSDYSQYAGSSITTGAVQYLFGVGNSPTVILGDEVEFTPPVKGGTLFTASLKLIDSYDVCLYNCNARLSVYRLSDGAAVASVVTDDWPDWAGTPRKLNWLGDYDDSYSLEVWYEGTWILYDLNVSYTDDSNVSQLYISKNKYVGSQLTTGNTARFLFDVVDSPPVIFDDEKTFTPSIKGGTLVTASLRFLDAYDTCLYNCNASLTIRRQSDNGAVAQVVTDDWPDYASTPRKLIWFADYDNSYSLEVWYQGSWIQYDLNVDYTTSSGSPIHHEDKYQFVGSNVTTGDTTKYYFNVVNSPVIVFDDGLSLPFKPKAGEDFNVTLRFLDGYDTCLFECDATLKIRRVSDGAEVAGISTGNWYNWFSPAKLSWDVADDEAYYAEAWYQGAWAKFDLNVDYTDTTGVKRHYTDPHQFVGSGLATGAAASYYFSGGMSCGNGINCAASVCVPVILNGDPKDKIDIVFVGSGFPDLDTFAWVVDDMIDYDGNEFGIMHYSPFKENREKFNFWRIDLNQTFDGGIIQKGVNWVHDVKYEWQASDLVVKECQGINEPTPQFITLLVEPLVQPHAYKEAFGDDGYGKAFIPVGNQYIEDCNGGAGCNNPWPLHGLNIPFIPTTNPEIGIYGENRGEVQRTVLHEFGHSFGGLDDEYGTKALGTFSYGSPNCDENYLTGGYACDKWANICPMENSVCCLPGCGWESFYRAYNNSIMNYQFNPADVNYMLVNEFELMQDINSYFNSPESSQPISLLSYYLQVSYSNGEFTLLNLEILQQDSQAPVFSIGSPYHVEITSSEGFVLYDQNIAFPTTLSLSADKNWFDANGNQIFFPDNPPIIDISDFNSSIGLPYFADGKTLKIIDINGSTKLSVDLGSFSSKFSYSISYGGMDLSSQNYLGKFVLDAGPAESPLVSANYVCYIGPTFITE